MIKYVRSTILSYLMNELIKMIKWSKHILILSFNLFQAII